MRLEAFPIVEVVGRLAASDLRAVAIRDDVAGIGTTGVPTIADDLAGLAAPTFIAVPACIVRAASSGPAGPPAAG